jgi:hypothetical protein
MNKLIKSSESVLLYKNISMNRLTNFIERIKYNCSPYKPISKKSLLNLIVDIYNEKIYENSKIEFDKNDIHRKKKLDIFFYDYMHNKFKMKKMVKQHCEETIMSILKYNMEDPKIDLFKKFLGVGDEQYRREIFDSYLLLLKCK